MRVEIELTGRRAPPTKPSALGGSIAFLILLLVLAWLFSGCAAHAASYEPRDAQWCNTYKVGFTIYTDCTPIFGFASPGAPSAHCEGLSRSLRLVYM